MKLRNKFYKSVQHACEPKLNDKVLEIEEKERERANARVKDIEIKVAGQ